MLNILPCKSAIGFHWEIGFFCIRIIQEKDGAAQMETWVSFVFRFPNETRYHQSILLTLLHQLLCLCVHSLFIPTTTDMRDESFSLESWNEHQRHQQTGKVAHHVFFGGKEKVLRGRFSWELSNLFLKLTREITYGLADVLSCSIPIVGAKSFSRVNDIRIYVISEKGKASGEVKLIMILSISVCRRHSLTFDKPAYEILPRRVGI